MTSFMQRSLKHWVIRKATREAATELKKKIEIAGVDVLKRVADKGKSIVDTYLSNCSPQDKASIRKDLDTLEELGVTAEMVLSELARQMPELAPIIEGRQDYKKTEVQNLERFRKES